MSNFSRFTSFSLIGITLGAMGFVSAFAGEPLGELDVRGQVHIGQQAGSGTMSVRDTSYGWFNGDRIDTRSGHAVLNLDEGGSFGFGEDTKASLGVEDGRISIDLESGVMLYAIDGDAAELAVSSGDYQFSTRSGEARAIAVASDTPMSAGMIEVLEDGEVRVTVHEGLMMAGDSTGVLQYQVDTGEAVEFSGTEPRHVEVQVEAARTEADGGDDGAAHWMRDNSGLAGMLIVAGAFGVSAIVFDDDDDDPEPVSP